MARESKWLHKLVDDEAITKTFAVSTGALQWRPNFLGCLKKYDKTIRIIYWLLPVNVFLILQVQVNSGYTPEAYACSPYKGSARGTHQVRELQIHLRMEIWRRESSGLKTILIRNGILLQLFIRELISISGNDFDMFIVFFSHDFLLLICRWLIDYLFLW